MDPKNYIEKTFSFKLGTLNIAPTYWQAAAIVGLLFLLVLTFARIRYLYVHWSLGKNATAFLFWGFFLALVLEGFLIIGGRTMFTEVLGWKNAPKPISRILDKGREKLISVLGINKEISETQAGENPTYQSVVGNFENLTSEDKEKARSFICEP